MTEVNSNHARLIGEKLQAARKNRRMSLRELAARAEISASMLSQIENGKAFPSVRTIYSIASALAVPVDTFFPEANDQPISTIPELASFGELTASDQRAAILQPQNVGSARVFPSDGQGASPVVHAAGRPTIDLKGGVTWARLTALAEKDAEFLEVSYAPGASSGAEMSHHPGREFGLVLEGELVVELGFDAHSLRTGDSIIFDSTTPHRLVNRSAKTVRAVWVVFSQE